MSSNGSKILKAGASTPKMDSYYLANFSLKTAKKLDREGARFSAQGSANDVERI